jgi:hypothetical protein
MRLTHALLLLFFCCVRARTRAREERIRRNGRVMAELGIATARAALAPPPKPPAAPRPPRCVRAAAWVGAARARLRVCWQGLTQSFSCCAVPRARVCSAPRAEAPPARSYPLRSRRATRSSAEDGGITHADDAAEEEEEEGEEAPLSYDDSGVRRYACAAAARGARPFFGSAVDSGASASSAPPASFEHVASLSFADAALSRVYAIDARGALLAAAGHGGRAALWGIPCGSDEGEEEDGSGDGAETDEAPPPLVPRVPLLSWRAHAGWASGAALLSCGSRLLTSGNDGALCLWDLTQTQRGGSGSGGSGAPRCVSTTTTALHRGGIWALHAPRDAEGVLWTASKDGSCAQSVLTPSGSITLTRSFSGQHRGVVRAVRAAPGCGGAAAACGGADGGICLLDARVGGAGAGVVRTLAGAHPAVNCVEWHPVVPHALLSAGSDPVARMWDLRAGSSSGSDRAAPATPLLELRGHCAPPMGTKKLRNVYRPAFVARGAAVASPGEGSRALSLYCAATGRALSRGDVGFDATLAFCCGGGDGGDDDGDVRAPLLLARPGGALSVYAPMWA